MVFSTEICRLCLNYTDSSNKFSDAILELITFLVKSNRFFPREYISTLVIQENAICDTCIKCLRTAVKLKKSQTASYEQLTLERKKLHLENLSLNRMSMFNNVSYDLFRVCSMCLRVVKDAAVYLYNNSKNLLPPHILRSMLIYCRLHLSSHIINPIMCQSCWEDLQIVYNFKKSSDEIENLVRFYCEANNKRRINKSDLEIVFKVKQHESKTTEKNKNNCEDLFDKFFNINSPRVNKVIGTVNISAGSNKEATSISSKIIETTTKGYCEDGIVEKVPSIHVKNFAVSNKTVSFEHNTSTPKVMNHVSEKINTETSSYSEILNREIFGPFDTPAGSFSKSIKQTSNYLRVSENLFSSDTNVACNRPSNLPVSDLGESTVRIKQEVVSDESDDNNESQTNLEALVDIEGLESNDNLYDTDFEMEELPPPLLEVQEPLNAKDVKFSHLQQSKNEFPNEHKLKLDALFTCDKCDFSTHFALPKRLHVQWHAENKLKLHCCDKCDYKTTRVAALRKHLAMHKQKKGKRNKPSPLSPTGVPPEQPPLLEPQQPCEIKCGNHLNKDKKSQLLNLHSITPSSPEGQDDRPVIYRTIGTPKHKRVLKIIGYLDSGKKIFGSTAKRGIDGKVLLSKEEQEEESEKKKLRRSSRRINPENLKAQDKLNSTIAEQNRRVNKKPPKLQTPFSYQCDSCDFKTTSEKSLDSHVAAHASNTLVLHYCVQCDYKTTKKSSLKEHHRDHLMDDGLPVSKRRGRRPKVEPISELTPAQTLLLPNETTDICPELDAFHPITLVDSSAENNRRSARRVDRGPPLLEPQQPCNEFVLKRCTIELKRENIDKYLEGGDVKTEVKRDWYALRRSEEVLSCTMCNFTTHFKSRMGQHECAHQTNRCKIYACDKCPYKITNEGLLKQHQREHRSPKQNYKKPFKDDSSSSRRTLSCDKCNYTTFWRRKKDMHEYLHRSNQLTVYSCDLCDYRITNQEALRAHGKQHRRGEAERKSRTLNSVSEPEMPILCPDGGTGGGTGGGTSYETKAELLEELQHRVDADAHQQARAVSVRLEKEDILYSAAKTYQDQNKDFETGLLEWFEKEILTNKTYGIKLLNQILKEKGQ